VHVLKKDNNGRTTKKICTGGNKETWYERHVNHT
jgi:hypothetical protein